MTSLRQNLLSFAKVILSQGLALLALFLLYKLGGRLPFGLAFFLLVQGLASALIGRLMGLWLFWMPIQVLLPFAFAYNTAVPAWLYPVAFVLCALVYWNGAAEQVPFYMTNRRTWKAISGIVTEEKANRIVDLGSGMGGIVTYLARNHRAATVKGVETAPLLIAASKFRLAASRLKNAEMLYRSIWDVDLAGFDLVYCFLSPAPMPRLYDKARSEMRKGSILVSNSFAVPDIAPERIIEVDDARKTRLYVYRF
jgi:SAM-dependent methyltransferase